MVMVLCGVTATAAWLAAEATGVAGVGVAFLLGVEAPHPADNTTAIVAIDDNETKARASLIATRDLRS
jgi:hypothetical protein